MRDSVSPAADYIAALKPGISGYTCVRNALSLDYPVNLTVQSLLRVCDEVLICDSDSTDGTRELLDKLALAYPRIRIINYPWPDPKGDNTWWINWVNYARGHLRHKMQLQLDADEVLDDRPHILDAIHNAAKDGHCIRMDRLNFWRDPHSLIPEGHCCGKYVVRLGPTHYYMPSDEPRHKGECQILDEAKDHHDIKIYHLGFLRRKEAFYEKAKVVLHAFFNRYDTRLETAEKVGKALAESECEWTDKLVRYDGYYPNEVCRWMMARGHSI